MAAGAVDDASAFAEFLSTLPVEVRHIAVAADALIRSVDPDVVQVLWAHQRTVGYGVGPKKMTEHYCYLDISERHLNLGFTRGASLADPAGLLDGSGANFRKITVRDDKQLADDGIRELLVAARAERLSALR